VTLWANKDEAFADVARHIREAVMSLAAGAQNPRALAQSSTVGTPPTEQHYMYLKGVTPAVVDPEAPQSIPRHLSKQPPLGPEGIAPKMARLDVVNWSGRAIRVSFYVYEPGNNKAGDPQNKWRHSDLQRGERAGLQDSVYAGNVYILVRDLEQRDSTPLRDGWHFFRSGGRYRLEIPSKYFEKATPFGQNELLSPDEYNDT
jgi:hypothetical protein